MILASSESKTIDRFVTRSSFSPSDDVTVDLWCNHYNWLCSHKNCQIDDFIDENSNQSSWIVHTEMKELLNGRVEIENTFGCSVTDTRKMRCFDNHGEEERGGKCVTWSDGSWSSCRLRWRVIHSEFQQSLAASHSATLKASWAGSITHGWLWYKHTDQRQRQSRFNHYRFKR